MTLEILFSKDIVVLRFCSFQNLFFLDCLLFTDVVYIYFYVLHEFGLSCSYVVAPYNEYPQLLGLLLKLLNGELAWSTRREVLKVSLYQIV